ncbi:secretin N-terminal domain-containing protein [Deinococcus sp.]|uniref:secretin N-terminal domain-containing protein n=1 Tax=Deinococcus sp. TaxID=47478 RepID=UPI003CC663E4
MTALLGLASVEQASAQSSSGAAAPAPATSTPATSSTVTGSPALSSAQSAVDPRLTTSSVSLEIGSYSGPLSSLLAAIAKSAGYDVIFETNVDALGTGASSAPAAGTPAGAAASTGAASQGKPVVYNFKNTPFNQVWPLLMDIYGLTYQTSLLGKTPVIRVGVKPVQQIIKLPASLDVNKVTDQLKRAFGSVKRTTQTTQGTTTQAGTSQGASTQVTSGEDIELDSPTLKIVAEPTSNSVIVRGTNSEVLQVQALANQIISAQPIGLAPSTPDLNVQKIYTVKSTQASVVSLLTAQYPNLKVTPVGTNGPIIISGLQSQVTAALGLLDSVDVNNIVQITVPLKYTRAATILNQVKLSFGKPKYTEAPRQNEAGQTVGVTRTLIDVELDSPTLRIVADEFNNRLILRGTNTEIAEVQASISQIDTAKAASPTTATDERIYSVKGKQADIVSLLVDRYPDLKVTPVGQTGQLIVGGPQVAVDAAFKLLAQVDQPPAPPATGPVIVQKVFVLTNASADDVKATLEGTLQRDVTGTGLVGNATPLIQADGTTIIQPPTPTTTTGTVAASTGAGTTPTPSTTTQATIISDKRSNTLIVRGTQAQVNQVAELIPSLDVKVPQVNVQVRIQEIGDTASRALGVDWKAGIGNFVVNVASGNLKAIFDPTQNLVGFNLGATLTALEQQNMTKRIYDGSVTMQSGQRSLGGNTQTQSASSGAAAHIQSGGRLELNIPSSAANVPAIQKQIDYGVTLDFFNPQVAPDGTITLRVRGVVNQPKTAITGSTLPNLLDFSNSEAQTTITFKAGETVLLSGLLGTNQTSTNSGIPFLTSIPVIGSLFGNQQTTTDRTQLLVVITGNVLQ